MDCSEFDCPMPAAGIIWPDIPRNVALGRIFCEGHAVAVVRRNLVTGQTFTFAPIRVVIDAESREVAR